MVAEITKIEDSTVIRWKELNANGTYWDILEVVIDDGKTTYCRYDSTGAVLEKSVGTIAGPADLARVFTLKEALKCFNAGLNRGVHVAATITKRNLPPGPDSRTKTEFFKEEFNIEAYLIIAEDGKEDKV
jgi:hypothetical protein